MKKLYIDRTRNIKDATVGTFELKDGSITLLKGVTLEPAGEDTVTPNKDKRIPEGEYNATFYRSPRFQRRLPILYNEKVSKDRHILIHNGNFPDDTLGCILVGSRDDNTSLLKPIRIRAKFKVFSLINLPLMMLGNKKSLGNMLLLYSFNRLIACFDKGRVKVSRIFIFSLEICHTSFSKSNSPHLALLILNGLTAVYMASFRANLVFYISIVIFNGY
nr:DUF5675 family protein [Campylobacter sp. RM16192]